MEPEDVPDAAGAKEDVLELLVEIVSLMKIPVTCVTGAVVFIEF